MNALTLYSYLLVIKVGFRIVSQGALAAKSPQHDSTQPRKYASKNQVVIR